MERLVLGKIPTRTLKSTVLKLTGADSDDVLTHAGAGVDFAAVRFGRRFMIVSADPITGVSKEIGTYAVRVSANDVATSGNSPQFAESVVLLPEGSSESDLDRVARQIHIAAKEAGIAILGGHTEVTPGLRRPILVLTVFSIVDGFVTSGDARDGDTILMTKTAGLEGVSELAREYRFPKKSIDSSVLMRARRFIDQISITKEAVAAFRTGRVHAMHDCTEGGVVGGIYEMSLASGLGFQLEESAVPVAPETREICDSLCVDPLRLIGSGSLLIAVERGAEAEVERAVRSVCEATRIGTFKKGRRLIRTKDGPAEHLKDAPLDELWRVLGRAPRGSQRL